MKVTFLGTNGWYNYDNHETSCVLLESKNFNIILDLGSGIKNLNNIKLKSKKTFIFISHLHLDHIVGIHYLSSISKLKEINIILHKKYIKKFKNIFNKPYTLKFSDFKNKISIISFEEKKYPKIPIEFITKKLYHSDPSYGFKFFLDKKIISYCTDTRYCKNLINLSDGSDLLILECNQLNKKKNFHLSFEEIKKYKTKFNTNKIALTHFGPEDFETVNERYQKLKKDIDSIRNIKFFITKDLLSLKI
jgi:ribonuclease BN (tRNA processing enzyme)